MKNIFIKGLIGIIFSIGLLSIAASAKTKNSLTIESLTVPNDAQIYAENIASEMVSNVSLNPSFYGVDAADFSEWMLGNPYTIFSADNNIVNNNDVYYFPILDGDEIKVILSVYKVNGEWSATISKDNSDELNELAQLNDNNVYMLYTSEGKLYAENKNHKKIIEEVKIEIANKNSTSDIEEFINKSFEKKHNLIKEKFGSNLSDVNIIDVTTNNSTFLWKRFFRINIFIKLYSSCYNNDKWIRMRYDWMFSSSNRFFRDLSRFMLGSLYRINSKLPFIWNQTILCIQYC
jgi:hypothetical protein